MKGHWIAVVIGVLGGPAAAGPLADALARHRDADVGALRAQLPDSDARCTLGAVYARRNDLPRAALFLAGCDEAKLPDDVAADIVKTFTETQRKLRASELSVVELISKPPGLIAEIDALPGETITLPATIWIAAGAYTARVTVNGQLLSNAINAKPHSRGTSIFDAGIPVAKADPKTTSVDFTDEPGNATGEQHTGPPPAIKHPPLTPEKYRGVTTAAGPQIDDPFAGRTHARIDRGWSLGGRVGGGMFDAQTTAARAGLALAVVGRFDLVNAPRRVFIDARLDWSRRGGTAMADHAIDTLGASPTLGLTLVDIDAAALSLAVGPRLDLRLQSTQDSIPVERVGFGAVIALDVELHDAPISAGVRYEHGITDLTSGSHDRAVIVELGFDWR